jgi:SlyX protein
MSVNIDERLIEIEVKITSQEDLTQELSRLVYQQQKQIDELRLACTALIKRMGAAAADEGAADPYANEKPPHY